MTFQQSLRYHNDLKQEYIDCLVDDVRVVIKSRIITIDKFERELDKDMLEWTIDDYANFFKSLKYTNASSLGAYRASMTKLGRYLCEKLEKESFIMDEVDEQFTITKMNSLLDKTKAENLLITCYDYENIINNTISKDKLVPIEQVFFMVFWHDLIDVSNNIFNLSMDLFDLDKKTAKTFRGEIVSLSEKEVEIIRELKADQEETIEIKRAKKPSTLVGTIEVDSNAVEGTSYFLVEPKSQNLIHPIIGSKYTRLGREESKIKSKPLACQFGLGPARMITDQIFNKTGIAFRPMSIKRSSEYSRIIFERNITLENHKNIKHLRAILGNGTNYNAYSLQDMKYILVKMAEQQLEVKYNK